MSTGDDFGQQRQVREGCVGVRLRLTKARLVRTQGKALSIGEGRTATTNLELSPGISDRDLLAITGTVVVLDTENKVLCPVRV